MGRIGEEKLFGQVLVAERPDGVLTGLEETDPEHVVGGLPRVTRERYV